MATLPVEFKKGGIAAVTTSAADGGATRPQAQAWTVGGVRLKTAATSSGLDLIVAAIARSPIFSVALRPAEPAARLAELPDRYEQVDLAILDWIVAEGRCLGRAVALF